MGKIYYGIVKNIMEMMKALVWLINTLLTSGRLFLILLITLITSIVFNSLIYATALAEKIVNDGQPAVDKFYNILKGGSSDYPIELIKKAGLDPLSSKHLILRWLR